MTTELQRYSSDVSGADTDEQVISMWLSGRPATTIRAYSADVARLRGHIAKPLRRITAADLIGWAETLARLKPSTQHRMLSSVKSLFSYALRLGYLDLDPAAALRIPKAPDDRASKLLSVSAVQSILAVTSGRDRLVCMTLYVAGLREAELVALDSSDLRETGSGHAVTVLGKGGKVRHIALPSDLAAELLEHAVPDQPLFRSVRGNRLSTSDVYRIVTKAAEAAGVRCSPHRLRHAHASHSLDNGAALHVVRDTLGHASLSTTSIYSHAKPSESSALYIRSKQ